MRWKNPFLARRGVILGLVAVVVGLLLAQAAYAQPVQPDLGDLLRPADARSYDNFGAALALDGDWLAVGAPGVDLEGARNAGAVYLFQRTGDAWQELTRLLPDPAQFDARFGSALAMDGETLAVGAPYEHNPGSGNASGAVYVFVRSGNNWEKQAHLAVTDGMPFDLLAVRWRCAATPWRWARALRITRKASAMPVQSTSCAARARCGACRPV
jgi:hypothetical protein